MGEYLRVNVRLASSSDHFNESFVLREKDEKK